MACSHWPNDLDFRGQTYSGTRYRWPSVSVLYSPGGYEVKFSEFNVNVRALNVYIYLHLWHPNPKRHLERLTDVGTPVASCSPQ